METKKMWVVIAVSAIVAVIATLIVLSVAGQISLSPASGTILVKPVVGAKTEVYTKVGVDGKLLGITSVPAKDGSSGAVQISSFLDVEGFIDATGTISGGDVEADSCDSAGFRCDTSGFDDQLLFGGATGGINIEYNPSQSKSLISLYGTPSYFETLIKSDSITISDYSGSDVSKDPKSSLVPGGLKMTSPSGKLWTCAPSDSGIWTCK